MKLFKLDEVIQKELDTANHFLNLSSKAFELEKSQSNFDNFMIHKQIADWLLELDKLKKDVNSAIDEIDSKKKFNEESQYEETKSIGHGMSEALEILKKHIDQHQH